MLIKYCQDFIYEITNTKADWGTWNSIYLLAALESPDYGIDRSLSYLLTYSGDAKNCVFIFPKKH